MDQFSSPGKTPVKWYFKTGVIVTAFLCVGPFALPLLWLSPAIARRKKILLSALMILISVYLWMAVGNSLKTIAQYYDLLNEMIKS
jgi:hypothetical protein